MTSFTCAHGDEYALFGAGGGEALADAIGVPLLGQVPLEPAVSAGGDAGTPVALADDPPIGSAAAVFADIAGRLDEVTTGGIDDEGVDLAGCSARLLASVESALDGAQPVSVGAKHG
jgi:ATP-binding protein involved in chromosome partitioning